MRKAMLISAALVFIAFACQAGDARSIILTANSTNAATVITGYADPFVGEIDEISVYTPAGVTGTVAVAAIDPYSSAALVLATNAVTGASVWRPRVMATSLTGDSSLTVTNAVGNDRLNAQGETFRAVLSEASKTSAVFRVVIKTK